MERLIICAHAEPCDKEWCMHKYPHYASHLGSDCVVLTCGYVHDRGVAAKCIPVDKEEVNTDESHSIRSGALDATSNETVE